MARRISLVDISSKRRRLRRTLLWSGILLALGLLVAGLFWVVIYSEIFKVKEVEVIGATYVSEDDVRSFLELHTAQGRVASILGPDNILAWPDSFAESELGDLPGVSFLQVDKSYFGRRISVTVTERERVGIWCFVRADPRRCFWFDPSGRLFMEGYFAEGNLIPLLEDHSRGPLALGDSALSPRLMPNLVSIFSSLQSIHLSVREVRLNDLGREEVEVYTREGPKLLFSLRFPAAGVPNAIATVEKAAKLSDLEYIDFRVENKVYYK